MAYQIAAFIQGFAYALGGTLPVSIIIHRWFEKHEGLALGICMAGSGLSSFVGTPLISMAIRLYSMQRAFRLEALAVLGFALLCGILIRDYPVSARETSAFINRGRSERSSRKWFHIPRHRQLLLMVSIAILGCSPAATSFLSLLYHEAGLTNESVAWLLSLLGAVLIVGKCGYGEVVDLLGEYRAGNLFYVLFTAGMIMSCLCIPFGMPAAVASVILFGIGASTVTVGLPVVAETVAKPEYYPLVSRRFQILLIAGNMLFGLLPGYMAEYTSSYLPSYAVMTVLLVFSFVIIQKNLQSAGTDTK